MSHAVQGHRQRHAGIEQISQLLREGGQLLKLRFAFSVQQGAHGRRHQRGRRFAAGGVIAGDARSTFGCIHRNGKQPVPLDLNERRRTVGHV